MSVEVDALDLRRELAPLGVVELVPERQQVLLAVRAERGEERGFGRRVVIVD